MADPRSPDPRETHPDFTPQTSMQEPPYGDPLREPHLANRPDYPNRGRTGLIAAGVIAVLLVIALIAFSTGPATDPGTTATIPEQNETMSPAPVD